ncbi:hypothetical protein GCM10009851_21330 [Herbiconiux moechotypicola]|uniref:Uncharacterized protein n=1 Tax=Herbiconiux moechotypicola TaxID=637393 RepID=A0ABN3DLX7_9MICO
MVTSEARLTLEAALAAWNAVAGMVVATAIPVAKSMATTLNAPLAMSPRRERRPDEALRVGASAEAAGSLVRVAAARADARVAARVVAGAEL